MKQRILAVGRQGGAIDKIPSIFRMSSVEAQRVPTAAAALELLDTFDFVDLVVLEHPLEDATIEEFLGRLNSVLPQGRQPMVVILAGTADEEQIAALEDLGYLVLPSENPSEQLEAEVAKFLRKDLRPPTRVMVRMEVRLGGGRLLRMAQSVNVSINGILVRTDERHPLGSDVAFEFSLPGDKKPIRGVAEVVRHTRPEIERVRGVGLRFSSIEGDGKERLEAFIAALLAEPER